jgi:hypothetical protein
MEGSIFTKEYSINERKQHPLGICNGPSMASQRAESGQIMPLVKYDQFLLLDGNRPVDAFLADYFREIMMMGCVTRSICNLVRRLLNYTGVNYWHCCDRSGITLPDTEK